MPETAPGRPIWPRTAASAIAVHGGCSPYRARWSDQVTDTKVRFAAIRKASAWMSAAATPVIPSAHSGVFGTPSSSPSRYASSRS